MGQLVDIHQNAYQYRPSIMYEHILSFQSNALLFLVVHEIDRPSIMYEQILSFQSNALIFLVVDSIYIDFFVIGILKHSKAK